MLNSVLNGRALLAGGTLVTPSAFRAHCIETAGWAAVVALTCADMLGMTKLRQRAGAWFFADTPSPPLGASPAERTALEQEAPVPAVVHQLAQKLGAPQLWMGKNFK
jgi:hypothetical protein